MLRLESEIGRQLDQTGNRQGFAIDDIAALDRFDLTTDASSTQFEKTGERGVTRGKWLLDGRCQRVVGHSRCREVPEHQIAEIKASGIMYRARRWGCSHQASVKPKYSIFAELSRIERGRPALCEVLTYLRSTRQRVWAGAIRRPGVA